MKQFKVEVISNSEVMPGVFLVWIESPQLAATARPGQFVMVDCGENTLLRRPFSIHQVNAAAVTGCQGGICRPLRRGRDKTLGAPFRTPPVVIQVDLTPDYYRRN